MGYARKSLKITGVNEVISATTTEIIAKTECGPLNISGSGLRVKSLLIAEKILEAEGVCKVNIIAHSKGGLDSKYMIENLGMEDHVASLTTLCTPHKGSPIATNILKLPKFLTKFIAFWINFWYKLFGDKNPDSYQACLDLKRINSIEEEIINFNEKVYCQSYSTEMKKSKDDFIKRMNTGLEEDDSKSSNSKKKGDK